MLSPRLPLAAIALVLALALDTGAADGGSSSSTAGTCPASTPLVTPEEKLERLAVAVALGLFIGLQREFQRRLSGQHDHTGVRTHCFICLGSCLFQLISVDGYIFALDNSCGRRGDPARVAAQVVTGVGFIAGGGILQRKNPRTGRMEAHGINMAATLWISAAVGMAVASGMYQGACIASGLEFIVLFASRVSDPFVDRVVARLKDWQRSRTVRVVLQVDSAVADGRMEEVLGQLSRTSAHVARGAATVRFARKAEGASMTVWLKVKKGVAHDRAAREVFRVAASLPHVTGVELPELVGGHRSDPDVAVLRYPDGEIPPSPLGLRPNLNPLSVGTAAMGKQVGRPK
jgi:putative Mg2+ transporter-C (MgtC) family protein